MLIKILIIVNSLSMQCQNLDCNQLLDETQARIRGNLCQNWHRLSSSPECLHLSWPYVVHYFWPGLRSKVVQYVGNRVPFGLKAVSSLGLL